MICRIKNDLIQRYSSTVTYLVRCNHDFRGALQSDWDRAYKKMQDAQEACTIAREAIQRHREEHGC